MTKPVVLVDGSSYFFRAFHALPPLMTSKGQPTGAIYGVANMIRRLIKDYQPTKIAVVFDAKGKTFRDEIYPAYKANRPPMPSELSSQFPHLITLLQAMGLPVLTIEGVEADDVIGTLAEQACKQGMEVLISTGDKDFAQLVNAHITLINTMSNKLYTIDTVKEKFGVWPWQMIDYLTLVGDATDNVPGVNKCGPKTAAKWLADYETLDNLLLKVETIGGKIGDYLRQSIPQLPISKELVTIRKDIPLPLNINEIALAPAQCDTLIHLTRELEFKGWLNELLAQEEQDTVNNALSTFQYELITTESRLIEYLNGVLPNQAICIHLETTDVDPRLASIVGIALAQDGVLPVYIPLAHQDNSTQLDVTRVVSLLKPILENEHIAIIGQDLKYLLLVLRHYDVTFKGPLYDTMLESYVLNSTASKHDTSGLALKYLGYKLINVEEIVGSGLKKLGFNQVPVIKAAPVAAEKAQTTLKLHQHLAQLLDKNLSQVLHTIEMPLVRVLADMEHYGVLIDIPTLETHGIRLKAKIKALEEEAWQLTGRPFNLNSPKQLQEILFQEQQIPVIVKTPTGQPSTAESVLQELAFDYRLPAIILEHRSLTKLVTTYIDVLPKRIHQATGRIHTTYNQAVTATGRLSSSEPNLQNIPIRNEEGRLIRKAFIAKPDDCIVSADYSQIELRIMAHLSEDPNLLLAFKKGLDIHTATASEIFAVPLEKVTSEQRRRAKAVNFGLIYGMSAFGLAKQLGIERQDAQSYIDRYFERYPGVLDYMQRTRKSAHSQGYVETIFGRRLYLPEINVQNIARQKAAERMAINAPMQGTAADIIKKAMLDIATWQSHHQDAHLHMIMQVHDELVFEVPHKHVEQLQSTIQTLMQDAVQLHVPLEVTIGWGKNWDEAH